MLLLLPFIAGGALVKQASILLSDSTSFPRLCVRRRIFDAHTHLPPFPFLPPSRLVYLHTRTHTSLIMAATAADGDWIDVSGDGGLLKKVRRVCGVENGPERGTPTWAGIPTHEANICKRERTKSWV